MNKIINATILGITYHPELRPLSLQCKKDIAIMVKDLSDKFKAALAEKEKEIADLREKYNELIMGVGNKFTDETRHQTALRYIIEREQNSNDCAAKTDLAAVEKTLKQRLTDMDICGLKEKVF